MTSGGSTTRHSSGWRVRAGRVLVVDDDPAVCGSIRQLLEEEHIVETAVGALEALRHLRAGARFDVILCDVMMPGIDGLDLLEAIRREVPEQALVVVLMGGDLDRPRRIRLKGLRTICIDKPLDVSRLLSLVRERVARARTARSDADEQSGG